MESKSSSNMWIVAGVVVLVAALGIFLLSGDDTEDTDTTATETSEVQESSEMEEMSNIVELAQDTAALSTLVDAVVAADLVSTLSDETAEYTVFAPTNDAFAALPSGTLDTLLDPANQADLVAVLTYHVVASEAFSTDLTDGMELTTVQGETLTVNIGDNGVTITDAAGGTATVVTADVDASNGVVHVIDSVLLTN